MSSLSKVFPKILPGLEDFNNAYGTFIDGNFELRNSVQIAGYSDIKYINSTSIGVMLNYKGTYATIDGLYLSSASNYVPASISQILRTGVLPNDPKRITVLCEIGADNREYFPDTDYQYVSDSIAHDGHDQTLPVPAVSDAKTLIELNLENVDNEYVPCTSFWSLTTNNAVTARYINNYVEIKINGNICASKVVNYGIMIDIDKDYIKYYRSGEYILITNMFGQFCPRLLVESYFRYIILKDKPLFYTSIPGAKLRLKTLSFDDDHALVYRDTGITVDSPSNISIVTPYMSYDSTGAQDYVWDDMVISRTDLGSLQALDYKIPITITSHIASMFEPLRPNHLECEMILLNMFMSNKPLTYIYLVGLMLGLHLQTTTDIIRMFIDVYPDYSGIIDLYNVSSNIKRRYPRKQPEYYFDQTFYRDMMRYSSDPTFNLLIKGLNQTILYNKYSDASFKSIVEFMNSRNYDLSRLRSMFREVGLDLINQVRIKDIIGIDNYGPYIKYLALRHKHGPIVHSDNQLMTAEEFSLCLYGLLVDKMALYEYGINHDSEGASLMRMMSRSLQGGTSTMNIVKIIGIILLSLIVIITIVIYLTNRYHISEQYTRYRNRPRKNKY